MAFSSSSYLTNHLQIQETALKKLIQFFTSTNRRRCAPVFVTKTGYGRPPENMMSGTAVESCHRPYMLVIGVDHETVFRAFYSGAFVPYNNEEI